MAYDSARGVCVLFGGWNGSDRLGDSWEWDGNAWIERMTGGPSPRIGHTLAFDTARNMVTLFGGDVNGLNGETWELGPAALDCNTNGVPDDCDLAGIPGNDCNVNGQLDACDIAAGTSNDADGNGIPDECEGAPAAALVGAVSRKANIAGPGGVCDLPLGPGPASEPRQDGINELRLTFDVPPGGPGASPVTIDQATCASPSFVPYSGTSTSSAVVAGNELVLTFTPSLENARAYRVHIGPEVTSIAGQFVEVRSLVGDVNSDGFVNAADRSVVVGAWTGSGFTCASDGNSDGNNNATDRSIVVGAWTGTQNCAP